jgi:hypothetical protein
MRSKGSMKKTVLLTLPLTLLVLSGCAMTPPKATERPPTVAGEVRLNNVAELQATPGFADAAAAAPEWVKEAFHRINRLEFLVELQPLR